MTLINTDIDMTKVILNMTFCVLHQGVAIAVYDFRSLLVQSALQAMSEDMMQRRGVAPKK